MKRVITCLLICLILVFSSFETVFAVNNPDFGEGYSNDNGQSNTAVAGACMILKQFGIPVSGDAFTGEDGAKATFYLISNALYDGENDFITYLTNDNYCAYDVNEAGQTVMRFLDPTAWAIGGDAYASLNDFLVSLFGDFSLTQPVNVDLQTPYSIIFNGREVIPWQLKTSSGSDKIFNLPANFSSRGEYVIPNNGDYLGLWDNVYSGTNHYKNILVGTYEQENNNQISAYTNFRATTGSNSVYGPMRYLTYPSNSTLSWYYNTNSGDSMAAFAYVPVITSQNKLQIYTYSYNYSGTFLPGEWKSGTTQYSYCFSQVYDGKNQTANVKRVNNGSLKFQSSEPVGSLDLPEQIVVDASTSEDILNAYYNDTLNIVNNYTDPNSWDTGTSGTASPDGNGGFNLDFDGFHMPDLNIDWKIDGLKDKFPFSIPWDLIRFFGVLNVEAEAPHIEGDIDLGLTTWEIDFDFSDFDDIAALFRNVFYYAFLLGLIIYTKDFLKR